jgi:hypothetical protein
MSPFPEKYASNFARDFFSNPCYAVYDVAPKINEYLSLNPTDNQEAIALLRDIGNLILANFGLSESVISGISGVDKLNLEQTALKLENNARVYLKKNPVIKQSHWWYAAQISVQVQDDLTFSSQIPIDYSEHQSIPLNYGLDFLQTGHQKRKKSTNQSDFVMNLLSKRSGISLDNIFGTKKNVPLKQIRAGAYWLLENIGFDIDSIAQIMRVGKKKVNKDKTKFQEYLN